MYFSIFCLIFRKRLLLELNMDYEDPLSIRGTKFAYLKRFFSKFVHTYISLSSSTLQHMKKEYPDLNTKLICNGVDGDVFFPEFNDEPKMKIRKELGLTEKGKLVVTCGAVCKRKGTDFLIDTWAQIIERGIDAHFVIIGPYETTDGTDNQFVVKILKAVKSDRFKGSVIFTGLVDNVNEYLRASDIFIFAGRQEGSPNVLREAMASGLPVVSLQLEGITDDMVVDNETGFVIPVDQKLMSDYEYKTIQDSDVQGDFISKLHILLNDNNLVRQFGRHGRAIISNKFSLISQAEHLISLIK
jgi:glycosyltransferase involved in cell wall biosynthesis